MAIESNFSKVSEAVMKNYEEYESVMKSGYCEERVISLDEFYRKYQQEAKQIEEEALRATPTLEYFMEAFKSVDEYPDNIQKPKKLAPIKDRHQSTSLKCSISLTDVSQSNSNISQSHNLLSLAKPEGLPTASETFNDFKKFQQHLKQLNASLRDRQNEVAYVAKLQRLNHFSQQLTKLYPKEGNIKLALTEKEEKNLDKLLEEIDNANATRSYYNILKQPNCGTSKRLEKLTQILSFCLHSVSACEKLNK
uniref:Hypothetical conserved protein n=1 Tax=Glossina morsitans morsitans TaxID=37546 RepID=D3TS72_GLOMM